jgi:hypothetical protein
MAIELRDMSGKVLIRKLWQLQPGSNTQTFYLSQFAAGTFVLTLQGDTFSKSWKVIRK